jgi:hypothetical protein
VWLDFRKQQRETAAFPILAFELDARLDQTGQLITQMQPQTGALDAALFEALALVTSRAAANTPCSLPA